MTPPDMSHKTLSPWPRLARFLGLVGLYMIPFVFCVVTLLWIAGRQEGASAFRYVGF